MIENLKEATTEELQAFLKKNLQEDSEDFNPLHCFAVMEELKLRKGELETPEQKLRWHMTKTYYYPVSLADDEELTDPSTGILLTPSWHGENCQGNGEHPGKECCCDECDHYQACFPDWSQHTA